MREFPKKRLTEPGRPTIPLSRDAAVAQLDRATGYEPVGREFESLQAHHKFQGVTGYYRNPFYIFRRSLPSLIDKPHIPENAGKHSLMVGQSTVAAFSLLPPAHGDASNRKGIFHEAALS